ncbi:hypothetical protein [Sphingobacterium thalpophilum]|uniref:hypothetical protein n=1 Tax=Sphingobacterium thalpophilum TaxID=259 RepID=UPI0031D2D853
MMNKILVLTLLSALSFGKIYGQESLEIYKKTDTVPKVFYKELDDRGHTTVEIRGKEFLDAILFTLKADGVQSVEHNTERKVLMIGLKPEYNPVLISLSAFKNKYTNVKSEHVIFKIDDRFVQGDPNKVLVDEANIMLIYVSPIKFVGDLTDLYMITLIPRTDANLKKFNEKRIILR